MWGFVDLIANKRQSLIVDKIQSIGAVSATELAKEFKVSIETVRRDLMVLEKKNLLERVHGGAIAVGKMMTYHTLSERKGESVEEKIALSITAEKLVCDGDVIFIDSGTTPVYFARRIKEKNITVVTASLEVFNELSGSLAKVILCGGEYSSESASFCGALALETLSKIYVSKAFICPSAVSLKHGICDFSQDIYPIQKQAMERCDKVYILASSDKFERNGLLKLSEMNKDFIYVTDGALNNEYKKIYIENGIKIMTGEEKL